MLGLVGLYCFVVMLFRLGGCSCFVVFVLVWLDWCVRWCGLFWWWCG